jgi:predicted acetyltransferase
MPKMMFKLVDFKGALESRAYASDLAGEVVFDLPGDDTSPWNRGRWRARWGAGVVQITKTRRADSKKTLIQADMGTMAVLYAGRRGAHDLRAAGLLQASDGCCDLLERAFPPQTPFMAEWF